VPNLTRQGNQREPSLNVSYWSQVIENEIIFVEMPPIVTKKAFVSWAIETREEILQFESKLRAMNAAWYGRGIESPLPYPSSGGG
jgi:hypothetical protein